MLLLYDLINTFKKEFFRPLIASEHVVGGQIHIKELHFAEVDPREGDSFWGYPIEKNGVKYLLGSSVKGKNGERKELNLRDSLPLMVTASSKVSHKGIAYQLIDGYRSATFKSSKTMSFKELIDKLSSLKHSNPEHQKIMMFVAVASTLDRVNFRISTPPGFGKDSAVVTMGSLLGNCATVETPTLAKLEYLTHMKWLAISEVIDLTKDQWRVIEQFLLAAGAFKPEITKHSKAVDKKQDILDITNFSLSIFYNDIDEYQKPEEVYFDNVTKGAVRDRFPPLRLWGRFSKDENDISQVNVQAYVKEHEQEYKDIIYALTYYKDHANDLVHGWTRQAKRMDSERWKTNFDKLLKYVDIYCDTQEEFTLWESRIYAALDDYQEMLLYPDYFGRADKKLSKKEMYGIIDKLKTMHTFKEKNNYLRRAVNGETNYTTVDAWLI